MIFNFLYVCKVTCRTVKLSNGDKDKTVVKVEQDIPKKKDPKDKKEKNKEKKKPLKKVKKKTRNDENDNDEQAEETSPEKLITYSAHP